MKNKKATGVDGMQAELWEELREKIKNQLFKIIRYLRFI